MKKLGACDDKEIALIEGNINRVKSLLRNIINATNIAEMGNGQTCNIFSDHRENICTYNTNNFGVALSTSMSVNIEARGIPQKLCSAAQREFRNLLGTPVLQHHSHPNSTQQSTTEANTLNSSFSSNQLALGLGLGLGIPGLCLLARGWRKCQTSPSYVAWTNQRQERQRNLQLIREANLKIYHSAFEYNFKFLLVAYTLFDKSRNNTTKTAIINLFPRIALFAGLGLSAETKNGERIKYYFKTLDLHKFCVKFPDPILANALIPLEMHKTLRFPKKKGSKNKIHVLPNALSNSVNSDHRVNELEMASCREVRITVNDIDHLAARR